MNSEAVDPELVEPWTWSSWTRGPRYSRIHHYSPLFTIIHHCSSLFTYSPVFTIIHHNSHMVNKYKEKRLRRAYVKVFIIQHYSPCVTYAELFTNIHPCIILHLVSITHQHAPAFTNMHHYVSVFANVHDYSSLWRKQSTPFQNNPKHLCF